MTLQCSTCGIALTEAEAQVATLKAERDAAIAQRDEVGKKAVQYAIDQDKAERQREELLKALRTVEWPCWSDIRGEYCCWACQASKSDGHRGTCVVQAALAPYSEERNGG